MACSSEPFDGGSKARIGEHVTVTAFQTRVCVRSVSVGLATFLVAVAAKLGYALGLGLLCMRIVAGLALNAFLTVEAGPPLIGGRLVACSAQFRVSLDRHWIDRMA